MSDLSNLWRRVISPVKSAIDDALDGLSKQLKTAVKDAAEDALGEKLAGASGYIQRKRSKFETAIVKEWNRRGLKTTNPTAAAAALDATLQLIL